MTTAYEADAPVYTRVGQPGCNSPIAAALRTQETFTREQVAWLMSNAMRWGYELRDSEAEDDYWAGWKAHEADEIARAAAALNDFTAKHVSDGLSRKWLREQYDEMVRRPRPNDHPGGAVAWSWDPPANGQGRSHLRAVA